jgi:hypothetical protein
MEKSTNKIQIKSYFGSVLFESEKTTIKDAVRGAVLSGADLRGADLSDADFFNAKFYGKGGRTKIKKSQVDDFLTALGVIVEE